MKIFHGNTKIKKCNHIIYLKSRWKWSNQRKLVNKYKARVEIIVKIRIFAGKLNESDEKSGINNNKKTSWLHEKKIKI